MRRLNKENFTEHSQVAEWYDRKFTEMGGSWHVPAEELDELLEMLGVLTPGVTRGGGSTAGGYRLNVLDLGCGDGKLMERILYAGHQPIGVDISPVAVEMATARMQGLVCPPRCSWVIATAPMEALPFYDNSMDAVISYGSIEHALDIPKAVSEVARVLRPGGEVLLYAPNEDWVHEDQPLETTMTGNEWISLLLTSGISTTFIQRRGDNNIIVGRKPS